MQEYKKCFKCNWVKPVDHFYKHPQMSGGRVNKCKECNKLDVRKNRKSKIDYYRAYDRARGSRQSQDDIRRYRENNPIKYRCHYAVGNALRSGNLKKQPCEICGTKNNIHAHHDDYMKPLDVRWLCAEHHFEWHSINGEGKNAHLPNKNKLEASSNK